VLYLKPTESKHISIVHMDLNTWFNFADLEEVYQGTTLGKINRRTSTQVLDFQDGEKTHNPKTSPIRRHKRSGEYPSKRSENLVCSGGHRWSCSSLSQDWLGGALLK
jgi:hypothetical protein